MSNYFLHIKKFLTRLFFPVMLLVVMSVNLFADGESNEYNIKAMFILNFMKYIEWPSNSMNDVFKIGIVGESEIYDALQNMTTNRNENKKIEIEKINSDTKENFQIIIISRNENKKIEELVKKFQGKGVLIISEECKNANSSAINLININNKIRFEINNTQARLGGIKISSKLASLAVSVQP